DDEPGQAHRELWEQVVVGDSERKLEPVPEDGVAEGGVHTVTREQGSGSGRGLLASVSTAMRGFQASASAASTSAKLMIVSGSPGFPRWAAAPLSTICPEPRGAGMA